MDFALPVHAVKGIGKVQAERLGNLGISTISDLLWHFPVRYEDMRPVLDVRRLAPGQIGTIIGEVEQAGARRTRTGVVLIEAMIRVGNDRVAMSWFGNSFLVQQLSRGKRLRFSGKVSERFPYGAAFTNPVFESADSTPLQTARILPVYDLTEGVSVKVMRKYVMSALPYTKTAPEILPKAILERHGFPELAEAFRMIHDPVDPSEIERARARFAFEEMYLVQLATESRRRLREHVAAPRIVFQEEAVKRFVQSLPYPLTNAQRKASWRILQDLGESRPMQRLLNGDVGAGKTAVAAIAGFNVAMQGEQTALLAPTEILANQHFATFTRAFAAEKKVSVGLLTAGSRKIATAGEVESVSQREFESMLRENFVQLLVGTHAILEPWVTMPHLALAVVDEQHRFGVEQRQALTSLRRDAKEPHFLSMTATPIPRSLALVLYGDLDLSVLDELPPGRTPVSTRILERPALFTELRDRFSRGERGYVVCPLIDASDALGVKSVEEVLKELKKKFPTVPIGVLHGRMKGTEKEQVMDDLRSGKLRCVVSTTVVEVGVDVPEATFIAIEGAERFGLAALHQLRGRVGRGKQPGFCFLVPSEPGAGTERLRILERETSGFVIAEQDLELRGHGDLMGKSQSGYLTPFKVASFADLALIERAKTAARETLDQGEISEAVQAAIRVRLLTHQA